MAKKKSSRRDNNAGQIVQDGKAFRARLTVGTNSETGRPIYKTAKVKTRTEAVEALERMIIEQGLTNAAPTARSNFGQFLDHWLETIKSTRTPNTYRQYEYLCRVHIRPHLGTKQVDKITRAEIQRLLTLKATQKVASRSKVPKDEAGGTLSGNTLRLIRACLHSAFEEAISQEIARKNPAGDVDLPRTTKASKKQFLTPVETQRFTARLSTSDLNDLFAFMISTGTRVGEATGIRWCDIDMSVPTRPVVWIRGQLQRRNGKLVYTPGTKTNQERCLPLSKPVAERIKAIEQRHFDRLMELVRSNPDMDFVISGPKADAQVFLNAEGRLLDTKHVNNRLAELCKEAGVPPISAHKLRHTAATLALAETGDLHGVQKLLGHAQVSLTADLYGHATAETLRPLSNAIERALRQATSE